MRRFPLSSDRSIIGIVLWTLAFALATIRCPLAGEAAAPSNAWSIVGDPVPGPAEAIGSVAHGCLVGASALPLDGPGYEVVRPSRRRYFGHPDMVDFVQRLGQRVQAAGLPLIYVGDMAQPRGGPLPFGHRSHENGLDADIWFTLTTRPGLTPRERETPDLPSMLQPGGQHIDPTRFGPRQVALLKLALADPRVDRIFVNPVIKLALCRGFAGGDASNTGWLHRLRPWWGHDDHFHVRLGCPKSSPDCEPQAPVPDGDGCDAALENWATHPIAPTFPPTPPPPPSAACQRVLMVR